MFRSAATKMILGLFIVSLAWTLLFLGFSISEYINPSYGDQDYYTESGTHVVVTSDTDAPTIYMFACSPAFIVFTICLFAYWRHRKRWDKLADDLPSYVRMYRRVKPEQVAGRMGISVKELNSVMDICMREGTVRGYNDAATGEFVSADLDTPLPSGTLKCPNCGAYVENVYLHGEAVKCGYCGLLMGAYDAVKHPKKG